MSEDPKPWVLSYDRVSGTGWISIGSERFATRERAEAHKTFLIREDARTSGRGDYQIFDEHRSN